ncbi:MAG: hypothetical protein KC621_34570 [Myxococcales bacterium]|nr:hypothetical protein [Myxococcales bacterium]
MDWRRTQVAADRTHHTLDGLPAYAARYREVLKFHEPGLAPAVADDGATHIDLTGRPAYPDRFLRTFGFYEGRASVAAGDGWLHVLRDGTPLYVRRYAWCGNFQEGRCTVRVAGGRYLHLRLDGQPAYDGSWRYAGDFRDGLAVVQRDDGLHSHVDADGRLAHGRWFADLDVFHKGFARARDDFGWTHVRTDGSPVYPGRFASVEPFYNGQARVERFDGALEVIDERGATVVVLRPPVHAAAIGGEVLARTAWGRVHRIERVAGPPVVLKWTRSSNDREVEALLALRGHPGAPALLERRRCDMNDQLLLSLCDGQPVGQPREVPAYPEEEAIRVTRDVLAVCEALHAAGWVHADVHPGNVMMGARTTLLDYACAVRATYAVPWSGEINWGAWEYVPPEMLADHGQVDPSVDVYAAACLCVAMVRGAPPFRVAVQRHFAAGGWPAVRDAFLRQRSAARPQPISEALDRVLAPALSPDPTARPTARRLAEALAHV